MRLNIKVLAVALASLVLANAAQAQTALRYKFKEGEKLDYVVDQNQKMSMSVGGMDFDIKATMVMEMTLHTIKVDEKGNAEFKFTMARVKMTMDGPTGNMEADSKDENEPDDPVGKILHQVVKSMGGMEMTFSADPTGETKDAKVTEGSVKKIKGLPGIDKLGGDMFSPENLKSTVTGIIIPLPKEAPEKGISWSQKLDTKMAFGRLTGENKFTYEGEIEKNGKKLQKIAVKPEMKIEPDGKSPFKIKVKDGKGKGFLLFDNDAGRLIESTNEQTMQMEIEILGQNVDQNITQNTTMRLKTGKKGSDKEKQK